MRKMNWNGGDTDWSRSYMDWCWGNMDWSWSYMDWSWSYMDWSWGDMNWCRGNVDRRLRDVNAMNLSSTATTATSPSTSSATSAVPVAASISTTSSIASSSRSSTSSRSSSPTASETVGLWYLNKSWRCFHCETLLAGHFPTCRGWNFKTGRFLCARTNRSVRVEADVLILSSAVPVGQGAKVAATSPTSRDVEADILPWRRLTLSFIHSEALL